MGSAEGGRGGRGTEGQRENWRREFKKWKSRKYDSVKCKYIKIENAMWKLDCDTFTCKKCEHERRKSQCKECKECKECGGSGSCDTDSAKDVEEFDDEKEEEKKKADLA